MVRIRCPSSFKTPATARTNGSRGTTVIKVMLATAEVNPCRVRAGESLKFAMRILYV